MVAESEAVGVATIDRRQAREALSDIDDIVRRVRQSRLYDLNSQIMVLWGVLVFAGNVATWLWPRYGGYTWITIDVVGVAGMAAISVMNYSRTRVRTFDVRSLVVFVLFFAFGYFCTNVLGQFTALTLIGYYFICVTFPLWMAFVNGGGLILGGLWMRRN